MSTNIARRAASAVAAATIGGALILIIPTTAQASPVLSLRQSTSVVNPYPKTATVDCPAGSWVVAVGGHVNGNDGSIALTRMSPATGLHTASASARSITGSGTAFSITVEAICARAEKPITRVTQTVLQHEPLVAVSCPAPTSPIGFGFEVDRPTGNWRVDTLVPNLALSTATLHVDGGGAPGPLTVIGICYEIDTDYPPAPTVALATSGGVGWPRAATVELLSTGFDLGAGGAVTGDRNHLDGFAPRWAGGGGVRAQRMPAAVGAAAHRLVAADDEEEEEDDSLTAKVIRRSTFH